MSFLIHYLVSPFELKASTHFIGILYHHIIPFELIPYLFIVLPFKLGTKCMSQSSPNIRNLSDLCLAERNTIKAQGHNTSPWWSSNYIV